MPAPMHRRPAAHAARGAILVAAALLALTACGGGGGGSVSAPQAGGPSAGPDEAGAPPPIVLAEPRNVYQDNRFAFAWASDGFTGSIFARIEFGFSFAEGQGWTLQHNGPSVVYAESGSASFSLRYQDGFFLMLAQNDSDNNAGDGYGIDVYPGDVTPLSPAYPCDYNDPCQNNIDFTPWYEFPRTAGQTLSLLIPRDDPLDLRYTVEVEPAADRGFAPVEQDVEALSATAARGIAWKYDFPTARARVSGCGADGRCATSETQPLERALVDGVDRQTARGRTENAELALSGDGQTLFTFGAYATPRRNPSSPSPTGLRTAAGRAARPSRRPARACAAGSRRRTTAGWSRSSSGTAATRWPSATRASCSCTTAGPARTPARGPSPAASPAWGARN